MSASKDLTDQRFGRLIARSPLVKRDLQGKIRWSCDCDCGNTVNVTTNGLLSNHTLSCGCLIVYLAGSRRLSIEITGQPFEGTRWTVIRQLEKQEISDHTYYECRCDCGNIRTVRGAYLSGGRSLSCGCIRTNIFSTVNRVHGMSGTPEYNIWKKIQARCTKITDPAFDRYGGRGIKCLRETFEEFYRDMGPRPSPQHSIDRFPDNDGPYSKNNARWATPREQANNTRKNRWITYLGETKTIAEWSRDNRIITLRLSAGNIAHRLAILGWSEEDALSVPDGADTRGHLLYPK